MTLLYREIHIGDLSHSKYLRLINIWQTHYLPFNDLHVASTPPKGTVARSIVQVPLLHHLIGYVDLEYGLESPSIDLVGDTSSIYDFTDDLLHGVPEYILTSRCLFLAHHVADDYQSCVQVTLVKLIADVPPEGTELPPLLDYGMEEA